MAKGKTSDVGPQGQRSVPGLSRRACLALGMSLGLGMALGGCRPIYALHGYAPSDEDLALIEVGRDTRDTVAVTIGRPTASGLLGDEAWFYVQSRWKTVGPAASQEIDRQVVAITFDDAGRVANIERFGLERGEIVAISRRVTTTNIRGKGILSQLFGNIGRLNTGDLFK